MIRGRRLLNIKEMAVPSLLEFHWNQWKLLLCYSFALNLLLLLPRDPWKAITGSIHALNGCSHGSRTKSVHKCQYCDHCDLQYLLTLQKHLQRPVNKMYSHSKEEASAGGETTPGASLIFLLPAWGLKSPCECGSSAPAATPWDCLCHTELWAQGPSSATEQSSQKHSRHGDMCSNTSWDSLEPRAKSLPSTKGTPREVWVWILNTQHSLSTHSYGKYSLWWAPKNPTPKLFTNPGGPSFPLSQQWAAQFCTVTFHVGPACFCHMLRCLWQHTEMGQRDTDQHSSQPGTGQIPAPQSPHPTTQAGWFHPFPLHRSPLGWLAGQMCTGLQQEDSLVEQQREA